MEQQNNTMIRIEALTKTYAVPGGTVDALKGIDDPQERSLASLV